MSIAKRVLRDVGLLMLLLAGLGFGGLASAWVAKAQAGDPLFGALFAMMVVLLLVAACIGVRAILSIRRDLRTAAADLSGTMAHLSAAVPALSTAASQQASGAAEQAAAVTETTVTVEELSRTAKQIAHAAGEAMAAAEEGQGAVRETGEGMECIKRRMDDVAGRILSLGEKSQRVGEINEIITDIAGKTHLLALNAAIESAAAGEFGARFAVVAAQVKELADETREATSQVKTVVQEIQSAINATVMATGETTAEVDRGAQLATRSGEAIEEIVERVQGIHVATQQQLAGSEQVVNAMRDIQDVVRQSAAGSQQAAEAAARLEQIANQLGTVISRLSHDYDEKRG